LFMLGISLPIEGRAATFSNALFAGLRLAIEEHNQANPLRPVKLVFASSGTDPAEAVRQLARQGADAVFGPLMSADAVAAGEAAEDERIPLFVPLATEAEVSEGRQYVLQANSSFPMRGTLMARHAVRSLRMNRLGVVYETGTYSEVQARAFIDEAKKLDAEIRLDVPIDTDRGWYDLRNRIDTDTLTYIDAVYVPATGDDARQEIREFLKVIAQNAELRVLGNGEWHDLGREEATSRHKAVYPRDFYVRDTPENTTFSRRYRNLTARDPNRLAYAGYDAGRFLSNALANSEERDLRRALQAVGRYDGLGSRFDFSAGNDNQAVFYLRYEDGKVVLAD
ncbi:MAG: ABC transporter substrate-binding protein, partial [Bacteroidota bacterium]